MANTLQSIGLLIDCFGAIIVVAPDIPPFRSRLRWTEKLRAKRDLKRDVEDGSSFLRGDPDYEAVIDVIHSHSDNHARPAEINVRIPDHPQDDGHLRYVNDPSDDSPLRGSIAHFGNHQVLTKELVTGWINDEIEVEQANLRQHYLKVGVLVLAIGFFVQFWSATVATPLRTLAIAFAASVVPFLFFHLVLDQDLEKH